MRLGFEGQVGVGQLKGHVGTWENSRLVLNAWSTDAHWVVVSNEAGARQGRANQDGLRGPYEGVWTFSMRGNLRAWECVENSRCKEDGIWCTRVDSSLCTPGPDT